MKHLLLLIAFVAATLPTPAQERQQGRFRPEAFQAKMEQYITEKAGLTPGEAKKFFPVMQQMRDKQRKLNHKIMELKHQRPGAGTNEAQYRKIVDKICDLKEEQADLEGDYYEKLCKTIAPSKVYAAMLAEDAFHREMLQHFAPGQGKGQRQRRQK